METLRLRNDNRLNREDRSYQEAIAHVYALAQYVCKTEMERKALTKAMIESEKDLIRSNESGKIIITNLMGVIMDGLLYNNWPWTVERSVEVK